MTYSRTKALGVVSLLLCIATSVIYFRGIGIGDSWIIYPGKASAALWSIPVMLAALSVLLLAYGARVQQLDSQCVKCRYNLRSSTGRCP